MIGMMDSWKNRHRRRAIRLDIICMGASASGFSRQNSELSDVSGPLVFREPNGKFFSVISCRPNLCILAFSLESQLECILCRMDSMSFSIKHHSGTSSSNTLSHRSAFLQRSSSYSVDDLFRNTVKCIILASLSGIMYSVGYVCSI